jgi:Taurine catabolism dioxygenase TauD, TfdA family
MAHHSSQEQAVRFFTGRPHVGIPPGPLSIPAAWRGESIRARGDYRYHLSAQELREIDAGLAHATTTRKPTIELTAQDLPLPTLSQQIARWRDELRDGVGFVVISGVPVERWSQDAAERFFWTFGAHLGTPGLQNPQGDLLGHVTDTGAAATDPLVRLYRTASNINYHCDGADVVGLLCLKSAPTGGLSRIASSVTVFNELWRQDPALAARLFESVKLDRRNEEKPGQPPYALIQPACFDGSRLRTFYHSDYYRSVTRHVGELPAQERELLDAFEAIAERPDARLDMQFAPGDIQLLSNHTIVHARTAYTDGAAGKRHLLRLWLTL